MQLPPFQRMFSTGSYLPSPLKWEIAISYYWNDSPQLLATRSISNLLLIFSNLNVTVCLRFHLTIRLFNPAPHLFSGDSLASLIDLPTGGVAIAIALSPLCLYKNKLIF
jgi:hypothetical protein